jgi:hypothetical protein
MEAVSDAEVLTITPDSKSSTIETFEMLNLGILLDFEYIWEQADKTYLHIWAEGYQNGELVKPKLAEHIYGLHPTEEVEDGNLSLGFIKTNEGPFVVLGTTNSIGTPQKLNLELLSIPGAFTWDYAIHEKVSVGLDETIILAAYRETSEKTLKVGYDYQDKEEIQQMINTYDNLILFKMKVVEEVE